MRDDFVGYRPRKRRVRPQPPLAGGDVRVLTSVPEMFQAPSHLPHAAVIPAPEPAIPASQPALPADAREPQEPAPPETHETAAPEPRPVVALQARQEKELQARQEKEPQAREPVTLQASEEKDIMDNSIANPAHASTEPASTVSAKTAQPAPRSIWHRIAAEIQSAMTARDTENEKERVARQAELIASRPARSGEDPKTELVSLPQRQGQGPRDSLAAFTVAIARTASSDVTPPDFARHARVCSICSHPDRDAIEADFLHWRNPKVIAQEYNLPNIQPLYRHARATGLLQRRKNEVSRVMERYLEKIDSYSTEEFDKITRAIRVYSHLDEDGRWFEPPRTHYILSGHLEDLQPAPPERASLPAPAQRRHKSGTRARKRPRNPR